MTGDGGTQILKCRLITIIILTADFHLCLCLILILCRCYYHSLQLGKEEPWVLIQTSNERRKELARAG